MTKENDIRILHIDSERNWRGGQQQAAYLLERLHGLGYKTALICPPGADMESYCRSHSLPCHPVAMHGEIDIRAGYKIASLCKKHRYGIAHLHTAHALATGLWARLFYPKLRLIAVRRVDLHIRKNPLSRYKYNTRRLDKIVCISKGIRKVMLSDGLSESRLATIHSGVDLKKFDPVTPPRDFKKRLGIPEDHILVGTVAAIAGHKDYPNLLHAAKYILQHMDNVSFCAVGDGPDETEVHALARRLDLGSRFVFAGFRSDVGNFLKSFDIFVLSSSLEGLGTSILDAQGVGLPVVACDTGGIPEAVLDNENGLLVPPGNSKALAEAILKLARDEKMRRNFGCRAKETVGAFSIDITVRKNIDLYRELIDTQSAFRHISND